MKKIDKIILVALLIISATACRNYVEDVPLQGVRTLTNTSDYRLLINNGVDPLYTWPILSGNDVYFSDTTFQVSYNSSSAYYVPMYTWKNVFFDAETSDFNWETPYAKIYIFNTVVDGVMSSKKGSDIEKNKIMSEALVHRAFSYWALVNMYAKQYDASTASTDLGVPMLLKPDMQASLKRATVKAVYDQIISDLKLAIPNLPALPEYNLYPSKAAAYALLARTYLFTRDFTAAQNYADSALTIQNTLVNYSTYINGTVITYPRSIKNPEIILSKTQIGGFSALQINPEIIDLLGTKDLRYQLFTRDGSQFWPAFKGRGFYGEQLYTTYQDYNNVGITVPEMYLIKAECLARDNHPAEAIDLVNKIRKNRLLPADYIDLAASTSEDALNIVIDERKREFFGRGLRWFDQRRLNKDAQFAKTVTRVFNKVTYTLTPNSNLYTYPIGEKYIIFNPEIVPNP